MTRDGKASATYRVKETGSGYVIEAAIPFAQSVASGDKVKSDLRVQDTDQTGAVLSWNDPNNQQENRTNNYGILNLKDSIQTTKALKLLSNDPAQADTPVTNVDIKPDIPSPIKIGTPITFTASSSGSPNPQYKFYIKEDGQYKLMQDYSSNNTFTWSPEKSGTYRNFSILICRAIGLFRYFIKALVSWIEQDISLPIYKNILLIQLGAALENSELYGKHSF